jgi:hypothetical protein
MAVIRVTFQKSDRVADWRPRMRVARHVVKLGKGYGPPESHVEAALLKTHERTGCGEGETAAASRRR